MYTQDLIVHHQMCPGRRAEKENSDDKVISVDTTANDAYQSEGIDAVSERGIARYKSGQVKYRPRLQADIGAFLLSMVCKVVGSDDTAVIYLRDLYGRPWLINHFFRQLSAMNQIQNQVTSNIYMMSGALDGKGPDKILVLTHEGGRAGHFDGSFTIALARAIEVQRRPRTVVRLKYTLADTQIFPGHISKPHLVWLFVLAFNSRYINKIKVLYTSKRIFDMARPTHSQVGIAERRAMRGGRPVAKQYVGHMAEPFGRVVKLGKLRNVEGVGNRRTSYYEVMDRTPRTAEWYCVTDLYKAVEGKPWKPPKPDSMLGGLRRRCGEKASTPGLLAMWGAKGIHTANSPAASRGAATKAADEPTAAVHPPP